MIKRFLFSLGALIILTGVASTLPVSANDCQNVPNRISANCGAASEVKDESETQSEIENHAALLKEQFKLNAQSSLEDKKTEVKQHTQEQRQKACEARKTNLSKRMSNALKHAKKHQQTFDKIYARVKDFVDSKGLTVENYDSLTSAVDTAKSDSTASISALESLDVDVDCTSQNVATSVSNFQQAVKSTRDSLKTYRSSITDLIKAVKGASSANGGQEAQE
jgi:nickel-dependent lactate racemase